MSDLATWLLGREPEAPEDLSQRVVGAVRHSPSGTVPEGWAEALYLAARDELDAALSRPGRVRETAFDLLVADALVTYACEAALESDRPLEALEQIVEVGRTR